MIMTIQIFVLDISSSIVIMVIFLINYCDLSYEIMTSSHYQLSILLNNHDLGQKQPNNE